MTITITVSTYQLPTTVMEGAQTIVDDPIEVAMGWSGIEQRVRKNTKRPRMFQIGYGIADKTDRQAIYQAFMTLGQLVGFLFQDWMDYELVNQNIGTGDGSNRTFLLTNTYTDGAGTTYSRRITRPVAGTITLTVNGVANTSWTLNPLGTILFNVGAAPPAGQAVVVTYAQFLCVVRFKGQLSFRFDPIVNVSVPTAQLMELFEV